MKNAVGIFLWLSLASRMSAASDIEPEIEALNSAFSTNWSYTYLKAPAGKAGLMREYVSQNWFKLDEQAVNRGLFRDYKIIDNLRPESDRAWDFIVAVEYYGNESYSDIKDAFEEIRAGHVEVEVSGFGGRSEIQIVRGERLTEADKFQGPLNCNKAAFETVEPFLGVWFESDAASNTREPFGILEFAIDPASCVISKKFHLIGRQGGYSSVGRLDSSSGNWIENFSNGIEFEWVEQDDDTFMVNRSVPAHSGSARRNQWISTDKDRFKIVEQHSADGGKTWVVKSTTDVTRR